MQKTCSITNQPFEIFDKEAVLLKSLDLPLPDISPEERLRALMAFRNEWKLYPRKCDATGDQILSAYAADSPYKVFNNAYWWSDKWNPLDYGRDFDFEKPFFEQLKALQLAVPREGTTVFNSENCEYNSHIRESKNCYLNSLVYKCEDLYFSSWAVNDKDVFDSFLTNDSTLCYFGSYLKNGYNCVLVDESLNCSDCFFSYQLKGCDHCIFSSNLANKSYHAFNKSCTKEEFEEIKKKYLNGSWKSWQEAYKEFLSLRSKAIQRSNHNVNTENVTGDHLYNCKNCSQCFNGFDSEDCYNSASLDASKDIYSCYSAGWPACEMVYNSLVTRGSKSIQFCNYTFFSNDLKYSDSCSSCASCFGCIGLRHNKYCILNKEYSKEDYEKMVSLIVEHMKKSGEWGQFFNKDLYPFAYNESAAQEFFPLSKDEAIQAGWRWREKDAREYRPSSVPEIPDNIKDIPDSFIKEILKCGDCGKNYKMILQELSFYRKMELPIPRSCPDCRHKLIFELVNPLTLNEMKCAKCGDLMLTTYVAGGEKTIYCEKCYLKEVY